MPRLKTRDCMLNKWNCYPKPLKFHSYRIVWKLYKLWRERTKIESSVFFLKKVIFLDNFLSTSVLKRFLIAKLFIVEFGELFQFAETFESGLNLELCYQKSGNLRTFSFLSFWWTFQQTFYFYIFKKLQTSQYFNFELIGCPTVRMRT